MGRPHIALRFTLTFKRYKVAEGYLPEHSLIGGSSSHGGIYTATIHSNDEPCLACHAKHVTHKHVTPRSGACTRNTVIMMLHKKCNTRQRFRSVFPKNTTRDKNVTVATKTIGTPSVSCSTHFENLRTSLDTKIERNRIQRRGFCFVAKPSFCHELLL